MDSASKRQQRQDRLAQLKLNKEKRKSILLSAAETVSNAQSPGTSPRELNTSLLDPNTSASSLNVSHSHSLEFQLSEQENVSSSESSSSDSSSSSSSSIKSDGEGQSLADLLGSSDSESESESNSNSDDDGIQVPNAQNILGDDEDGPPGHDDSSSTHKDEDVLLQPKQFGNFMQEDDSDNPSSITGLSPFLEPISSEASSPNSRFKNGPQLSAISDMDRSPFQYLQMRSRAESDGSRRMLTKAGSAPRLMRARSKSNVAPREALTASVVSVAPNLSLVQVEEDSPRVSPAPSPSQAGQPRFLRTHSLSVSDDNDDDDDVPSPRSRERAHTHSESNSEVRINTQLRVAALIAKRAQAAKEAERQDSEVVVDPTIIQRKKQIQAQVATRIRLKANSTSLEDIRVKEDEEQEKQRARQSRQNQIAFKITSISSPDKQLEEERLARERYLKEQKKAKQEEVAARMLRLSASPRAEEPALSPRDTPEEKEKRKRRQAEIAAKLFSSPQADHLEPVGAGTKSDSAGDSPDRLLKSELAEIEREKEQIRRIREKTKERKLRIQKLNAEKIKRRAERAAKKAAKKWIQNHRGESQNSPDLDEMFDATPDSATRDGSVSLTPKPKKRVGRKPTANGYSSKTLPGKVVRGKAGPRNSSRDKTPQSARGRPEPRSASSLGPKSARSRSAHSRESNSARSLGPSSARGLGPRSARGTRASTKKTVPGKPKTLKKVKKKTHTVERPSVAAAAEIDKTLKKKKKKRKQRSKERSAEEEILRQELAQLELEDTSDIGMEEAKPKKAKKVKKVKKDKKAKKSKKKLRDSSPEAVYGLAQGYLDEEELEDLDSDEEKELRRAVRKAAKKLKREREKKARKHKEKKKRKKKRKSLADLDDENGPHLDGPTLASGDEQLEHPYARDALMHLEDMVASEGLSNDEALPRKKKKKKKAKLKKKKSSKSDKSRRRGGGGEEEAVSDIDSDDSVGKARRRQRHSTDKKPKRSKAMKKKKKTRKKTAQESSDSETQPKKHRRRQKSRALVYSDEEEDGLAAEQSPSELFLSSDDEERRMVAAEPSPVKPKKAKKHRKHKSKSSKQGGDGSVRAPPTVVQRRKSMSTDSPPEKFSKLSISTGRANRIRRFSSELRDEDEKIPAPSIQVTDPGPRRGLDATVEESIPLSWPSSAEPLPPSRSPPTSASSDLSDSD